jgi:hypothetical protein
MREHSIPYCFGFVFFKVMGVQNNTVYVKNESLKVCSRTEEELGNEYVLHGVKLSVMRP